MRWFSGLLRQRITLQQAEDTPDGQGGAIRSWQNIATVWAAVSPLHGSEKPYAQQHVSINISRFAIRYRSDVNTAMRIQFDNRIFNILSVDIPNEMKTRLIITAQEETPV